MLQSVVTAAALLLGSANAFYLPGVAPTDYHEGDRIPLFVNSLTPGTHSNKDASHAKHDTFVYSYDYYYPKFHFCKPKEGLKKQLESLGAIVFGDRIFNSPFEIKMLEPRSCVELCKATYTKSDATFVNRNIRAGYSHNWIIDGLPAAKRVVETKTQETFLGLGFSLGEIDSTNVPHLANHFDINIEYHKRKNGVYRVVGFTVDTRSVHSVASSKDKCATDLPKISLSREGETEVYFTYSVNFEESSTAWATRWDKYLHVYDPKIQWFSLINFSLVVVVLGLIIAQILARALKNDIVKYNEVSLDDEVSEESGWKLLHADVFRPPKNVMFLSIFVGSGVQIFMMAFVTILFAMMGLLSPSNRGLLATCMFVLYMFFSFFAALVSSYLYRFFGGEDWKLNMILTPIMVPGALFCVFVLLNFFLIGVESSGAVPVGTMVAIVALWFVLSIPLSVAGSIFSARVPHLTVPVRTNQIPRQIPPQKWFIRTIPATLVLGLFPFGSISVEMYFIYSSLWFNRIFYMFGFLFFCFVLMIATTSLVSVLVIYYTLCGELYKWQWKSLFVGGGCAFYVFVHSLLLVGSAQLSGITSIVLYVGYSAVLSVLVFLCCGAIGFLSNLMFLRQIYGQVKLD